MGFRSGCWTWFQACMATPSHMSGEPVDQGAGKRGVAIGVDGGATKTRCVVIDLADRRVLGSSQANGSNWCACPDYPWHPPLYSDPSHLDP